LGHRREQALVDEDLQPRAGVRIPPGARLVEIEDALQVVQVGLRAVDARLIRGADDGDPHHPGDQPEDDHHDHDLDQRHAAACSLRPDPVSLPPTLHLSLHLRKKSPRYLGTYSSAPTTNRLSPVATIKAMVTRCTQLFTVSSISAP